MKLLVYMILTSDKERSVLHNCNGKFMDAFDRFQNFLTTCLQ